jgi:hypothetical protein
MCEAANFCGVLPRRMSFTRTCAHIMETWMTWVLFGHGGCIIGHNGNATGMPDHTITQSHTTTLSRILKYLGSLTVPNRPGRFDPRVIKRRLYRSVPLLT